MVNRSLRCVVPHTRLHALAPLAQLEEQLVYTQQVGGSSPSGRTISFVLRLEQQHNRGILAQ